MLTAPEYAQMCNELGFTTLEGITLKWNRNAVHGNYITVERDGEELYAISDPARMERLASLTREMYRSKEEEALEDSLWQS